LSPILRIYSLSASSPWLLSNNIFFERSFHAEERKPLALIKESNIFYLKEYETILHTYRMFVKLRMKNEKNKRRSLKNQKADY